MICLSRWNYQKKAVYINIFQTIFQMKVIVQYFHKQPTDKEERVNIISSLNSRKASGPTSIPYRMLFPLKKWNFKAIGKSSQPSFHDCCFYFCTQNCKSSSCFSCIKDCIYTFLNNNNIYDLQSGFRQQYSTSHTLIKITENIRRALDDGDI